MPVQRVDNEVADAAECVDHGVAAAGINALGDENVKAESSKRLADNGAHTVAPSDDLAIVPFKRFRVTAQGSRTFS